MDSNPEVYKIAKISGKVVLYILKEKFKETLPKFREFLNKIKYKKEPKIPILTNNDTKKYIDYLNINENKEDINLRKYLKDNYWEAYMLGKRAHNEKQKYNLKELSEIKIEARNRWGKEGITIVNFVVQNYFEEIIKPLLNYQIKELKIDSEIMKWLDEFLKRMIDYFPRAFWVGGDDSKSIIKQNIQKRVISTGFKDINIHTIKEYNIKKVKEVIEELAKDNEFPKFDVEQKKELPGFKDWVTFNLKIK